MKCGVHNKEMKQNSKGWYCPTPVTKSADDKQVLEWCKWQPTSPETPPNPAETVTREPLPQRDYDAQNRGKVRHGIVVAMIEHNGLKPLAESEKFTIDALVDYIMGDK